jgi:hypothetical protein
MKPFNKKIANNLINILKAVYERDGQTAVFDWVRTYNNHRKTGEAQIPFEECRACATSVPCVNSQCLVCGQPTEPTKMQISIKVTGSGTRTEIIESLEKLLKTLKADNGDMEAYLAMGVTSTREDATLLAEFKELTE